jgi:hypothetical protein
MKNIMNHHQPTILLLLQPPMFFERRGAQVTGLLRWSDPSLG